MNTLMKTVSEGLAAYRIAVYAAVNYTQQKAVRENDIYEWILTAQD